MRPSSIDTAIEKLGSVKAVAARLGVKPQSISQWRNVPVARVKALSELTGLSKHKIRPDIFEDEAGAV